MGRKKIEHPKTEIIPLRLDRTLARQVKLFAKMNKRTVSDVLRELVLGLSLPQVLPEEKERIVVIEKDNVFDGKFGFRDY